MLLFSSDFRSYCLIRSRLGRKFVARNVAATVREPALIGTVTSRMPSPWSPAIPWLRPTPWYLNRCARSPSTMQLQLLARDVRADAEVLDRELVLAVGREIVAHQHAAARAERQPLDVVVLRGVAGREVGGLDRRLPVADRHPGHARRRRGIRLQQRRRDRQRPGDVVEAARDVVRRQERRDVDLQVQQVAHGVARTPSGSGGAAPRRRDWTRVAA